MVSTDIAWIQFESSLEFSLRLLPSPVKAEFNKCLAEVQARLGNGDETLRILSQLQTSGEKYVSPSSIALIYASLGDIDQSFSWNERAFQERDASLVWLRVAPESDSVRSDPRFADLLHRMNFPNG